MSAARDNRGRDEWRPVPGYEGSYEINRAGVVRSHVRRVPVTLKPKLSRDRLVAAAHPSMNTEVAA